MEKRSLEMLQTASRQPNRIAIEGPAYAYPKDPSNASFSPSIRSMPKTIYLTRHCQAGTSEERLQLC